MKGAGQVAAPSRSDVKVARYRNRLPREEMESPAPEHQKPLPTFAEGLVGPQFVAALAVPVHLAVVAQHPRRRHEILPDGVQVIGEALAACKARTRPEPPAGPAAAGGGCGRALPSGSFSLKHW